MSVVVVVVVVIVVVVGLGVNPGRAHRFRPGLAAISTGVASFNRDLLTDIF